MVDDGVPGRRDHDQRRRSQGRGRRSLRGLQALHDCLPLRDDVLRPVDAQGVQVQPLRRRPGVRGGVPDGRHHLRGRRDGRLARRLRPRADRAGARGGTLMARRHLIIGGGTAGMNAIRTIREEETERSTITLVSAEKPYSRMVLPYYLDRSIAESHVFTATARVLADWGVTTQMGKRATALDTKANVCTLDDGTTVEYDDCVIATGSSAVRAPVPGADGPGVHSFWTLDQARGVLAQIQPGSHVVMVGAGFIAFTILNSILALGAKLTIVEVAPRILPRMIDDTGAQLVEAWLTKHGVGVRTGAKLTRIDDVKGRLRLKMAAGGDLVADVVIMATGIRTNLDWLKSSGVKVNQGVVVDDHLRSSVPNVYAAGDVAEGPDLISQANAVHAIEPTAQEHGRVVEIGRASCRERV